MWRNLNIEMKLNIIILYVEIRNYHNKKNVYHHTITIKNIWYYCPIVNPRCEVNPIDL